MSPGGRGAERFRATNFFVGPFPPNGPNEVGMTTPVEFLQQVRVEASKVVWPTRRETLITTALVLAMAVLAAVFFLVVDWGLQGLVGLVLGFGRTH
jgi:preprotein translocase subunit SecE